MADLCNFSRKESLVERKRRQWAQEKAELQEWYPFGKPGAGAPLKSPIPAMDQPTKSSPQDLAYNSQAATAAADVGRNLPLRNGVDNFDGVNGPPSVVMPQRMDASPYVPYNTGESSFVKLYPFPYSAFYHETGQFYHPNHQVATSGLMQAQIACPHPPPARFDGFVPQGQAAGQLITATDSLYSTPINRPADPFACPYYHGAIGQPRLMPSNTAMPLNHAFPCASSTPYRALSTVTTGVCQPPGGAFQGSPIGIEMDRVNNLAAPATAYVSPMIFGQQMPQPPSYSPNGCDVRSLCSGGDAVDSSLLTMHDQAMSKSYPGTSDDYGIHKRRAIVTAPRNEYDLEERRARSIQQKKAIDEQIQEQRRKKLEEAERERKEMERIERERQRIEFREAMESKMERSKWKRMQDLEQMRENAVLESWEKAKEDAALMKHARLRKHASLSNNEDEFVLVAGLNGLEDSCPTVNGMSTANGMSSSSAFSDNNSEGSHSRSDYGRVPSRIAADERPIKPLSSSSPLDMWDDLISKQRSAADTVKLPKKDITAAGETKENGAPPSRRTNGQDSLHRSKSDLTPTVGSGSRISRPKASLRTSIVRPLMRRRQEKTTPEEAPTASLPKSVGFGERLSKKLSFSKSGKKESSSNGLPPPSPSAKTKGSSTASSLISQLSASLHIGSRKSKRQPIASSVPLARKNRASVFVPENPFGDSFGGLNPLCQPLNTRNRRTKRTAETDKGNVDKSDEKLNNASMEKSVPSSLSNSSSIGEYDTVSSPPCTFSRSPSLRSPSLSGFNSKSPLYQTISSKIRCSTESQKKVMEQLFQLRKQLKEKQKAIEDAIMKPMIVQKPSSLAAGNGL
ncbi:hypothetical protein M514_12095 [Trichuris suis]|uniref:CCDC66 domain-containing protein n=1 Tax=Trichuris suis TaxID=68888 RepID=A0A085MUZ2_9BILA|nr:hypothetical protein M513_12095 [Trichuris suis]KFD61038.1 hypothetical protein M514_12095 [Trichuris suis]